MPAPDRGAVIARGARTLIIWGPRILGTPPDVYSREGWPLYLTVFRADIDESLVETIIGNLTWDDPEFPVTVID